MNAPVKIAAGGIHSRMVEILREMDAIGKDQNNAQQGFKYRGIDQVYNAINPLLAKHGVFMTAEVLGKSREERTTKTGGILAFTCLRMRYHFHATDGTSVMTEAEGEGMDSGDKSSNKAMAVAHKYALLQAFCVPTKDLDDPDKESHEVVQRKTQREAIHGTTQVDDDVVQGTRNWVDKQKDILLGFSEMDHMTAWLKKQASVGTREGNWDRPTPSSTLDKLLKFSAPMFNELKNYYMEKMREV